MRFLLPGYWQPCHVVDGQLAYINWKLLIGCAFMVYTMAATIYYRITSPLPVMNQIVREIAAENPPAFARLQEDKAVCVILGNYELRCYLEAR